MTPEPVMDAPVTRIQEMPRSAIPLRVCAAPPEHFGYLLGRLGYAPTRYFEAIEAFDPGTGRIWGMVGYDNWTPNAVEMHVVLDAPIVARVLLPASFDYAFNQCDRRIAIGRVASDNAKAMRFDEHIGFKELFRVKDGQRDGVDIVVLELRKKDCRWLKGGK